MRTLTGERRWFRNARFGMFVHFGLYALHGGSENDYARGILSKATYEKMAQKFNPAGFDADEWAELAKAGGAKYVVLTAKHGEGFCLWDSRYTSYKITNTPFGRDLLAELAAACRKRELRFGVYYSIGDWHCETTVASRPGIRDYPEYVEAQIRELMTGYGRIDLVWFDSFDKRIDTSFLRRMADLIHSLQPSCVLNERGIAGFPGIYNPECDYVSPERYIPEVRGEHFPVECCDAMGQLSWGYHKNEQFWSVPELIKRLSRVAGFAGNYLLNVEPGPDGRIRRECVERMRAIGKWLKVNGKAIFGAGSCPLEPREGYPVVLHDARVRDYLPVIGLATMRRNCVYLHLHSWPIGDTVLVRHVVGKVKQVKLLCPPARLSASAIPHGLVIKGFSAEPPASSPVVVKIVFTSSLKIDQKAITAENAKVVRVFPGETVFLRPETAECRSGDGAPMLHYFKDETGDARFCWFGRFDQRIVWRVKVARSGKYSVVLESEKFKSAALRIEIAGQSLKLRFDKTEKKIGKHVVGKIRLPAGRQTIRVSLCELGATHYFPHITGIILSPVK